MPLQVGIHPARSLIRAFGSIGSASVVLFVVGTFFILAPVMGHWYADELPRFLRPVIQVSNLAEVFGLLAWAGVFVGGVAGTILMILGFVHLYRVFRNPPTDMVLDSEGIRVVGRGLSYSWDEVVPGGCEVVEADETKLSVLNVLGRIHSTMDAAGGGEESSGEDVEEKLVTVWHLMIPTRDGDVTNLAKADDSVEMESFQALCDTIRAVDDEAPGRAPGGETRTRSAAPQTVQILACTQCASPVRPEDAETVTCAQCGAPVPVPAHIRERVRAARQVSSARTKTREMVRDLVQQPGSRGTSVRLFVVAALLSIAWILMWGISLGLWGIDALTLPYLLIAAGATLALSWASFYMLRAYLVGRGALRLFTLRFGARPPEKTGDPHGCRTCGAPLPSAQDEMIVRCVYCDTENILPLDLRREGPVDDEPVDLDEMVGERRKERRKYLALAGISLTVWIAGSIGAVVAAVVGIMTRGG